MTEHVRSWNYREIYNASFGEIEGRVTKKLSQEFYRTGPRILGALSELYEFPLQPQGRKLCGFVPGIFWNTDLENREPTWDHSQNDAHFEVEFSARRTSISLDSDQEETSHSEF